MRINWNYIKILLLLALVTGLYAFSNHRNKERLVNGIKVEFVGDQNLYITPETVNKLLIQKFGPLINVPKEKLVLDTMENVLRANEMIKSAQVYLAVNGELTSKIVQRKPIARIEGAKKCYLDDEGKCMPLSPNHSARVPIITGAIDENTLKGAFVILEFIDKDDFLRKNIIGIKVLGDGDYGLRFRTMDFLVDLGDADQLDKKFNNFKAFYVKVARDKSLEKYNKVSLEFDNQVVCTKK